MQLKYSSDWHKNWQGIYLLLGLVTRPSRFFDKLGCRGSSWVEKETPSSKSETPGGRKPPYCIRNWEDPSLALMKKMYHANPCVNWVSSLGARAASILSTLSCFSSFKKWYRLLNRLNGIKGFITFYEKFIEHCFLASWVHAVHP